MTVYSLFQLPILLAVALVALVITINIIWINMIYHRYIIIKKGTEQTHFYFTRYIPAIWMRSPYAFDIPYIYLVYTMHIPVRM